MEQGYDAEGRICAVYSGVSVLGGFSMTGYLYDAGGTRVAKGSISAWSCDPTANGFTTTNDYILGLGGEQLTEMGMGGTTSSGGTTTGLVWQHANIWAGGKLLGTYDKDGLHFYLDDPLGTRRAQTDAAGVLEQTCSSLPFGDGLACSGGDLLAPTENHFTGKERDFESGNDYFEARYYNSAVGRFLSPDWSAKVMPVPYATLDNPQTLNLYAYVGNNPMTRFDADGHWMGWEHVEITQLAYDKAGMKRNGSVIIATRDVDAGGTNVYGGAIFRTQEFKDAQDLPASQKFHFLRNPGASQLSAYNDSMKYITDSANYARSALIRGNQGGFANNMGSALHSIQDSFAHTWRENGTGAISHIECYLCSGKEMDHEHPPFSLDATTGLLGPEAAASVEASSDFLKLMNGSDKMTDAQFQTGLKAYEDKWFKQTISK